MLPNFFKKKQQDPDETPQSLTFLQKNWLPLCVGVICVLLVGGYLVKTFLLHPRTAPASQTYDCSFTLSAVGDISLSGKQLRSFRNKDEVFDFSDCFRQVAQSISGADLAVGNLEGTVTTDETLTETNVLPLSFLSALSDAGFDLLQTANSFTIQKGISAIDSTMSAMEATNLISAGTFRSQEERETTGGIRIVEKNGIRIAFVAFTKGLNNMHLPAGSEYAVNLLYDDYDTEYSEINETGILSCLNNAKAASCDFIVAMVHWGSENETQISESQEKIADLLLDNGVDVIIGSHSHIVSRIEHRYVPRPEGGWKDAYIAYSLGDFLTSSEQPKTQYGCILNLKFEKDSESGFTSITDISYTPTYCTSPSRSMSTTGYAVLDSLNAIRLREEQYYDAISEALSEKLAQTMEALIDQTECKYQIKKDYSK